MALQLFFSDEVTKEVSRTPVQAAEEEKPRAREEPTGLNPTEKLWLLQSPVLCLFCLSISFSFKFIISSSVDVLLQFAECLAADALSMLFVLIHNKVKPQTVSFGH